MKVSQAAECARGSCRFSSHAPFQLRQRQPPLRRKAIRRGDALSAGLDFTMQQVMNEPLAGLGLFPDVKLSLCQTERNAFAAVVENQKRDHLFTQLIFDLAG